MNQNEKAPIRKGLRDISMAEYWRDPLVVADILRRKLNTLPINEKTQGEFAEQMRLAVSLLHHLGARRYGKISLLATIDLLQAVDYVLLLEDQYPDSRIDGYRDDAERIRNVFQRHREEIQAFETWLKQHN